MAIIIHEFLIPTPTRETRASRTVELPASAEVLGVVTPPGDAPRLVVRGDPQAPTEARTFVAVRADVPLSTAEQAATWRGAFVGYRTESGPEIWHVLEITGP